MNEVEKHYATQPKQEPNSGLADKARSGVGVGDDVSETASRAVKKAAETARETVDQASEWARDRYGETSSWAAERYDNAARSATYVRRRSVAELHRSRDSVGQFVEENPIMVGVVGLAAGLLMGALLPGTRRENELLGRYADEVRDQGLRYAQNFAEQGRQLVEENIGRVAQGRTDRDMGDETNLDR